MAQFSIRKSIGTNSILEGNEPRQTSVNFDEFIYIHIFANSSSFTISIIVFITIIQNKMSRISAPVTKLTHAVRGISSRALVTRPSGLRDAQSRALKFLPRNINDLRAECKKRSLNAAGNKSEVIS